jgi:hypothetical protein
MATRKIKRFAAGEEVEDELEAVNASKAAQDIAEEAESSGARATGQAILEKMRDDANKKSVSKPAAKPAKVDSKKEMTEAEAKKQLKLGERPSSAEVAKAKTQLNLGNFDRNENYGNEGRGRARTSPKVEKAEKPKAKKPYMPDAFDNSYSGSRFKSGGSVRSASSRADGIAIRGKTRA